MAGSGTPDDPWRLTTAPGSSASSTYRDESADPPRLVCIVGSTTLTYRLRAIDDLHEWLVGQGGWVALGAADEQKDAAAGSHDARKIGSARSDDAPETHIPRSGGRRL